MLTAAASAFQVIGGVVQGISQRNQGEAEAAYLRQQADQERLALERDLTDSDREASRTLARTRAVLAAQGGDTTTGGALDLISYQQGYYGEQRQRLIHDSDARIRGLNARAESARSAGQSAMWGSIFGGLGRGLSSGVSLFSGPRTPPTGGRSDPTRVP